MAPAYAPQSHPSALGRPVSFDRLVCVLRTGRVEAAIAPHKRRNAPLIESYQEQQDGPHGLPRSGSALVPAQIGDEQSRPAKKACKCSVDLTVRRLPNRRPGNYNAVPSWLNLTHAQSHRFTHPPLYTVSYNRIADTAAHRKAEAAIGKAILQNAQDGKAVAIRLSRPADLLEPAVVPYSIASFQAAALPKDSVRSQVQWVGKAGEPWCLAPHSAVPRSRAPAAIPAYWTCAPVTSEVVQLECSFASGKLDSQFCPLLQPTPLQNIASAGFAHAFSKAVCPQPFANLWLPGSFGHIPTPSKVTIQNNYQ